MWEIFSIIERFSQAVKKKFSFFARLLSGGKFVKTGYMPEGLCKIPVISALVV